MGEIVRPFLCYFIKFLCIDWGRGGGGCFCVYTSPNPFYPLLCVLEYVLALLL